MYVQTQTGLKFTYITLQYTVFPAATQQFKLYILTFSASKHYSKTMNGPNID